QRTPDLAELLDVVAATLVRGRATPIASSRISSGMHNLMLTELEKRADLGSGLAQRERLWGAVASMLGNLAELTCGVLSLEQVVQQVLASFLDGLGFPSGALYMGKKGAVLTSRAELGISAA